MKKRVKKKKEEKDLEKEWKKLRKRLEQDIKQKLSKKEKGELEESEKKQKSIEPNIENQFQEIQTSQAQPSMKVEDMFSVVLPKQETPQPQTLEENVSSFQVPNPEQNQPDATKTYSLSQDYLKDKKYDEKINPLTLSQIRMTHELPRQEFLDTFNETDLNAKDINRVRIDIGLREESKNLPFEAENKKYKEVRL
ncbi:MAG: hypothetical protein DRM99_05260 [Thermoplasmata archaeon]|nr:MAG: hypothetical protein DRM99_05260 [Thermoplasmata archaeon]